MALRNIQVRGRNLMWDMLLKISFILIARRGYEVYAGILDDGSEVDFVAIGADTVLYYQVAATTLEETTLKRELAPFKKISDNYPKYLLTLDEAFGAADYDGIKKQNVLDWLLEGSSSSIQ